jgi:hypothetical protein
VPTRLRERTDKKSSGVQGALTVDATGKERPVTV